MRQYLDTHLSDFMNKGKRLGRSSVTDVVFDHCCMMSTRHLDRMTTGSWSAECQEGACKVDTMQRVLPWHFEQYQDEAVFIPAGCLHQVGGSLNQVELLYNIDTLHRYTAFITAA